MVDETVVDIRPRRRSIVLLTRLNSIGRGASESPQEGDEINVAVGLDKDI